jgi:hypothetical protein
MAALRVRAWQLRTAAIAAGFIVVAAVWTASGFHRAAAVDIETVDVTAGPIVHHVVATGTLQAISTWRSARRCQAPSNYATMIIVENRWRSCGPA